MELSKKYLIIIIAFLLCNCNSNKLQYIESDKPGLTPKIFAPNFISKEKESEFGSIFSKDGKSFYYGVDIKGRAEIRFTELKGSQWTKPKTIISHEKYSYNDPFLTPDENELYYISTRPRNELDTLKDYDIWYSKKMGDQWSAPINAGDQINSDKEEYYISFTNNGTMYFASNKNANPKRNRDFDIYTSKKINGKYQEPVQLSDAINTNRYEGDVFISPDESYIIFCANRGEVGRGDLYISFKSKDGTWSKSKLLGREINTENHELCPYVTADGNYFFYTSNQDIYWVSTKIFDQFKE